MPALPRITARPGSFGRQASGADFGAAEGAARAQGALLGLEQTAQALVEADQSARISRATAQAAVQLDDVQAQLAQDPDFATHDERFEKARDEILQNVGQGILPGRFHGELEDRLFSVASRVRADVRDTARRKLVDQSVALLDETGKDWAGRAARAPMGSEKRSEAFTQYSEAIRSATGRGILTAQDALKRLQDFEMQVSAADRLSTMESDPAGAYKALADPENPLARGLTEAQRLQARITAREAFEHELAQGRASAEFEERERDRATKQAADAAQRNLFDRLAAGDVPGAQQVLSASRNVLSPDDYRWGLDRIAQGGGLGTHATTPGIYLDLSDAAARGEPVRDAANAAVRGRTLTADDRDKVIRQSEDRRFGSARSFLDRSFRQGEFDFDPVRQLKSAEALRQLDVFMEKNPDASAQDVDAFSRGVLRDFGIRDSRALKKPTDPVATGTGKVDTDALFTAAFQKFQAGQMSPEEYKAEQKRIQALDASQTMAETPK